MRLLPRGFSKLLVYHETFMEGEDGGESSSMVVNAILSEHDPVEPFYGKSAVVDKQEQ